MNTRADIHRELFARLAAEERNHPHVAYRPGMNHQAGDALVAAAMEFDWKREDAVLPCMRRTAMDAAVAAIRVLYSLDDALS